MPFSSWLLHDIGQKTKLCPKKNTLMGPSFPNKLIVIKNNKIYYTVGGGSYLWAKMKTQIDILLFFAEKGT